MRRYLVAAAALALAACNAPAPAPTVLEQLNGRWDVQQVAGASLGEGVDAWIAVDAAAGAMHGFTGCAEFTANVTSFGELIAISDLQRVQGDCPNAAAATDEQRLLGVLPSVQRQVRHGRSLQLLPSQAGGEALVLLRLADTQS